MATTIFIALQCFQCSTMQVKQQKKSSNKWTCVVCNQKQSVRKVLAQGFMAKDVRKFVQSFNMSRQVSDLKTLDPLGEAEVRAGDDSCFSDGRRKHKRSDWSEYLDAEGRDSCVREGEAGDLLFDDCSEDGAEIKIVTELPKEMFKKPKLRDHASQSSNSKDRKLHKPSFSERNAAKKTVFSDEETNYKNENAVETQMISNTAKRNSRWSDYMSQDENNMQSGRYRIDFSDDTSQWSDSIVETITSDQKVEEDVHPDFR